MKKTLLIIIVLSLLSGCSKSKQNSDNIPANTIMPYRESSASAALAPVRPVFIPSASDLEAFLDVFPEIDSFPYAINGAPPIGYPSLVKNERAPDPGPAAEIMNWDPPADLWRPANWRWDIAQEEESPSPDSFDGEFSGEEAPLGDADYEGEWEHGFYALCRIVQPDFLVLIAAYSEAFSYPYSDPYIKERYEYRLVTIAPDGRLIDSIVLFPSCLVETYHDGSETNEGPEVSAVLNSDLSLQIKERSSWEEGVETVIRQYTIDAAGSIQPVGEADQAQGD